jgi:hypothetical protein
MKTKRKIMGRPPTPFQTREKAVMFYLTPQDAEWFNEYAQDFGFNSRSQLITAIMERLRLCGMSPVGCFRMGTNLQALCEQRNPDKFRQASFDLHTLTMRPFPAIPDEDFNSPAVIKKTIADLQQQIKELKKKL